jgi:hypothetical protein
MIDLLIKIAVQLGSCYLFMRYVYVRLLVWYFAGVPVQVPIQDTFDGWLRAGSGIVLAIALIIGAVGTCEALGDVAVEIRHECKEERIPERCGQ